MKKLILIPCLIIFLFSYFSYSQIKSIEPNTDKGYWNASFSAGPAFINDAVDKEHSYFPGYNAGFEVFYMMKNQSSAVVLGFSFSRAQAHDYQYNNQPGYTEKKEITFGPRFYTGKGYYFEAALSNFLSSYNFPAPDDPGLRILGIYDRVYSGAGFEIGAGKTFDISSSTGLILKARIGLGLISKATILNSSLNAGIVFNNKETMKETGQKPAGSKWYITLTGGLINPEFFHSANYSLGGNFGVEAALKNNPNSEFFWGLSYHQVKANTTSMSTRNIIDVMSGPRFYFGSQKASAFFEMGAGLYFYNHIKADNITPNAIIIGGKFGPGISVSISKHFSFIAKSNIHFVFDDRRHPAGFLTAAGGLRYML